LFVSCGQTSQHAEQLRVSPYLVRTKTLNPAVIVSSRAK
jgi:hypothetical protein